MILMNPSAAAPHQAIAPMKLGVDDLMTLRDYGLYRREHRPRLIAHRQARTMELGPAMRLQFEDVWTIRYQIQEVLHAEQVSDSAAAQQEIDAYARLLPDGTQWKAPLLIGLPDPDERARELPALSEAAHRIYVQVGTHARIFALANEDQCDRHLARPSGVHFLRFPLPGALREAALAGATASFGCSHPRYEWHAPVPAEVLMQLRRDLVPGIVQRCSAMPYAVLSHAP